MGDSLSKKWNVATGGGSAVTDWLPMGRYLNLAAENWDHFTGFAIIAYRAGHEIAMDKAAQIKGAGVSAEEAEARLEEAYAINAFADHFLTDLFSAGHMRAPRRELYQQVMTPVPGFSGSLGSLLCRSMHDEDSRNGLKVWNKAGESWTAYGDKRLFDDISKGQPGDGDQGEPGVRRRCVERLRGQAVCVHGARLHSGPEAGGGRDDEGELLAAVQGGGRSRGAPQ